MDFIQTLLDISAGLGYWGVFFLMAIESSFIPFPSEIVVPPAAYLAAQGEMNVYLIVLLGILGSLVGASVNYWLARSLGRFLIYELVERKWARFLLLSRRKLERAERHFLKYGALSTFLGRLVPAVRQLISLPAGFAEMKFGRFLFYTGLGSGLWVTVLAILGYYFGANETILSEYYMEMSLGFVGLVVFVVLCVYLRKRRR